MRVKLLVSGLVLIMTVMIAAWSYGEEAITVVTEEYPPYNYTEGGKVKGVSTEVVEAVLKLTGIKAEIEVYPWPRTYHLALNNKNTLIYSITRMPQREELFKWVGRIAPAENYLFALKERTDIQISTLEDAKKYKIATVQNDVCELYLLSKGFEKRKNVRSDSTYPVNMEKLLGKLIDMWAIGELPAYSLLRGKGLDPSQTVRKVFLLEEISGEGLYMAFSKSTSDEIVEKFKTALEKIKKDGTYGAILKKYL
ncbi:MAG: hypothetical protein BWK80_58225 [Desulfobacteraceae bacterium IS3]|nr:MAG: hypothetical protein BWK80_58225 [Desulfobacteraceae bacterium IS3]